MDTVRIQFLRPWSIYAPGDTVALEANCAQALMDGGIAQRRSPPVAAAPAKPKTKPPKSAAQKKAPEQKEAPSETATATQTASASEDAP